MSEKRKPHSDRIAVNSFISEGVSAEWQISRIDLEMGLNDYEFIDGVSIAAEGRSLMRLSEQDARRAYEITRSALCRLAGTGSHDTIVNGRRSLPVDGVAPLALLAHTQKAVELALPEKNTTPFDLNIGIYPSQFDIHFLGSDPDECIPVFDLQVPPGM